MSLPPTLSAAVDRISDGVPSTKAIPEFLDAFYRERDPSVRAAMLDEEPCLTGDRRIDALAGAICEYLSKRYELASIPGWASGAPRFLGSPWFTTDNASDGMREFLTFSSPAEFARRNIFTDKEPLRRASQHHRPRTTSDGDAPVQTG